MHAPHCIQHGRQLTPKNCQPSLTRHTILTNHMCLRRHQTEVIMLARQWTVFSLVTPTACRLLFTWMKGPSFPATRPAPMLPIAPRAFTTRVFRVYRWTGSTQQRPTSNSGQWQASTNAYCSRCNDDQLSARQGLSCSSMILGETHVGLIDPAA